MTPRGAHGSYKKKSVPQRIPVKITKKNYKKKPGGELVCKNFVVNGMYERELVGELTLNYLPDISLPKSSSN